MLILIVLGGISIMSVKMKNIQCNLRFENEANL